MEQIKLKYTEKNGLFFDTVYVENENIKYIDKKTGREYSDVSIDSCTPTALTNILKFVGIGALLLIDLVIILGMVI